MAQNKNDGRRTKAVDTMSNVTAYGVGIFAAIVLLGPLFGLVHDPFVEYVTGYYGEGFGWLASLFLFFLMGALIAGTTTIIIFTLIEIGRRRAHYGGFKFNPRKKGNFYD